MYGIKDFTAVIKPAEVDHPCGRHGRGTRGGAATGGSVAAIMSVTLSCDHRAVDGALGAD